MPLNLPRELPAVEALAKEGIVITGFNSGEDLSCRTLRIIVLNLMPMKITTETDIVRLLSNSPHRIELSLMKLKSHTPKHTSAEHMKRFYREFGALRNERFDGMIITGAPVEHLKFEEVTYWNELKDIFDWSRTNVTSTMFVCWAAQAGLYYFYGIPKYPLPQKMFGIFPHRASTNECLPILRGFDDTFFVPHSRHTEIRRSDIVQHRDLQIVAESEKSGVYMVMTKGRKEFFITGHPEYAHDTLGNEYKRDLGKGLYINMPENYYKNNNPEAEPEVLWRGHANLLFSNWLNYYVCED